MIDNPKQFSLLTTLFLVSGWASANTISGELGFLDASDYALLHRIGAQLTKVSETIMHCAVLIVCLPFALDAKR